MPTATIHGAKLEKRSKHLEPRRGRAAIVKVSGAADELEHLRPSRCHSIRDERLAALLQVDFEVAAFHGLRSRWCPSERHGIESTKAS